MSEADVQSLLSCSNPECTVAQTGICLQEIVDFQNECAEFSKPGVVDETVATIGRTTDEQIETEITDHSEEEYVEDHLNDSSFEGRRFWAGNELGIVEVNQIMSSDYVHFIGVVGFSNVGKTCFLISLYLYYSSQINANRKYNFAGSRSILGFEERAFHTRRWNSSQIPDQLAEHTILKDDRVPGFLHLRLSDVQEGDRFNILFNDLPGEWFSDLIIDSSYSDKLQFLKRANGILFLVDGELLYNNETKNKEVHRADILLGRLVEAIEISPKIPITIVVTKSDVLEEDFNKNLSIQGATEIVNAARKHGFQPKLEYIAAFSRHKDIPNGFGVEKSISRFLQRQTEDFFWSPHSKNKSKKPFRSFHAFSCSPSINHE